MKEQERLVSKRISKTESVQSQLDERLDDDQIYVGPSDFIPFLGNTKLMFMRIEGRQWANIPYNMEVRLVFCVDLCLVLCFLPREVPLAFAVKPVWWC